MSLHYQPENLAEPKEVLSGLYRIRLPQPKYGSVYVHLAVGGSGPVTLFDAGLPHEMTQNALTIQLKRLGVTLGDIEQIVYTHSHVDHMGGGAVLSGRAGHIKHVAHADCIGLCEDFSSYNRRTSSWKSLITHLNYTPEIRDQARRYIPMDADACDRVFSGESAPESAEIEYHAFAEGATSIHFSRGLGEGDTFEAGQYLWETVETPGHNPHHLVFVEAQRRASVTGDVILEHGTPIMRSMGDDVSVYLRSLVKLTDWDLGQALPSHGPFFSDGNRALRQTMNQREELLDWAWNELERQPRRLIDLSFAALQAGVAGKKVNPILLIGVMESAVFNWCACDVVAFDEQTGEFEIIFREERAAPL